MRNIRTIAFREYNAYFSSPIAYVLTALMLLVVGIVAWGNVNYAFTNPGYIPTVDVVFNLLVFVLVFTIPAITMRLMADETRTGTVELLQTAPIKDAEVVIGKWVGAMLFMLSVFGFTLLYPIFYEILIQPGIDWGPVWSGYLGLVLVTSAFVAIGLLISTLFSNLVAAFISTMGTFLVIWFLMALPAQVTEGWVADVSRYIDFRSHFNPLLGGLIGLSDVLYYLSVTIFFLYLGAVSLESRRWRS